VIVGTGIQLVGLSIVWFSLWHVFINRNTYRYLEIQRFLQWAERDIKEIPLVMVPRLHEDLPGPHVHTDAPVNGRH
jgi:hypothetical protein